MMNSTAKPERTNSGTPEVIFAPLPLASSARRTPLAADSTTSSIVTGMNSPPEAGVANSVAFFGPVQYGLECEVLRTNRHKAKNMSAHHAYFCDIGLFRERIISYVSETMSIGKL
jgi:hypothetical protein